MLPHSDFVNSSLELVEELDESIKEEIATKSERIPSTTASIQDD